MRESRQRSECEWRSSGRGHWRQTDSRRLGPLPLAETMQTVRCCHVSTPLQVQLFPFFSGCLVSPARLSWPSIGSCRLTALSRDSELSAWYSYDDLRCKTIPNHRSLLPRLQNRILLYHILSSRFHLNILWSKCGSVVLLSALFLDCLSEFLFV